jgi:hypothetical protein
MEKKYNSKSENFGEFFEEISLTYMTCLVAATVIGSLLLLIFK